MQSAVSTLILALALLAVALCMLLHVGSIALVGAAFGIGIREVRFGYGPRLLRGGRVSVALLPIGGYVRFTQASDVLRDDKPEELREGPPIAPVPGLPLDGAPLYVRLLIALSGCVALLVLAFLLLGAAAGDAMLLAPAQLIRGAFSPMGEAQVFLGAWVAFLSSFGAVAALGLVAAKIGALNLLPLPALNGGYVLAELARSIGIARYWPRQLSTTLLVLLMLLGLSWAWAIGVFVMHLLGM